MKKRMIRCALMVSSLWFFCGCRSLFPLNDDPVVTHSASEDDANVISEENVVNPVEVPEGVSRDGGRGHRFAGRERACHGDWKRGRMV